MVRVGREKCGSIQLEAFLWHERFICEFLCSIIMNVKGFSA